MGRKAPSPEAQAGPQIESIATADLIPYARNARTHSESQVAQIAGSIQEFGFTNPVLIDSTNGIIAGHGRVMAAQKLGLQSVPCIRLGHLSEVQKRAYILADNRIALNSGWDDAMLEVELAELHADEYDLGLLGFDADELSKLMGYDMPAETPVEVKEDEVPEPPADPITKPGDLWILGEHRLLCGDSTKAEDVARLMAGVKANCILTDPPYGIGIASNPVRQKHAKADWDAKPVEPKQFVESVPQAIVWGGNYFDLPPAKGFFVWDKKQPEDFTLAMCEMAWTNIDTPAKMFRMSVTSYGKEHPTQKPVGLMAWCLSYTDGDVFDPFLGSGTTLIAAEQLNRKCYGMEISPQYCDVIVKRWETLTGKTATLEAR
jgi:ParB-like chromosome segregation protein Spo0J